MAIRAFNRITFSTLAVLLFLSVIVLFTTVSYCPKFSLQNPPIIIQNISLLGEPYVYANEVDFRIIIITLNRPQSLLVLLESIKEIELDGDSASLEIWIDRDRQGQVDSNTVDAAISFHWRKGPTRVYVHSTHVGIYGQWILTWRPKSPASREIALILEDDMSVSKYCYRWLKRVHGFYETSAMFAGATLQSDTVLSHDGSSTPLKGPKNHTVFMYKCIGTWGFSPKPAVWIGFQNWFRINYQNKEFCPCVPGISPTKWYKNFKKQKREDSMWSAWFIYYAYEEKLFTLYSNLKSYNNDFISCLSINRREKGLHYDGQNKEIHCQLLNSWKENYVDFPKHVTKLDWNGKYIDSY